MTGTGSYLPLLPETLAPLNSSQGGCSVVGDVPNGNVGHFTRFIEGIILPFSARLYSRRKRRLKGRCGQGQASCRHMLDLKGG